MAGLFHTLNMGAESLHANRQGVDTAGHNIANAQVEGYSRQRVNIEGRTPLEVRGLIIGNGVFAKNITRAHDKFLEKQLNLSQQSIGRSSALHENLKTLEEVFSPALGAQVSDEMSKFFNSMQDLSSFPDEMPVRTAVRESAQDLIMAFKRVDDGLRRVQGDINIKIQGEAEEMTAILRQVATLNADISSMEGGDHRSANDLRDSRDRLVRDLSKRIDIHYYEDQYGMMCVRGPQDTILVDGKRPSSFYVTAQGGRPGRGFNELVLVDSEGGNLRTMSDKVRGGKVQALFEVRDNVIEGMLDKNNELAASFIENVNSVHRQGYGLKEFGEHVGRNFFAPAGDQDFTVRNMRLDDAVAESIDAIAAASSPSAPGDNVIANQLSTLKDTKFLSNGKATFNEFYSDYIGMLGLNTVRADNQKQADEILHGDLVTRREGVAGVSLDEEAVNILKWQAAFTASSKVITTTDEMIETVLSLKR